MDSATGKKATWPGAAQGWFNPLTYEKGARLASGSFLPNKCLCARCKNFGRDANECEESHAPRVLLLSRCHPAPARSVMAASVVAIVLHQLIMRYHDLISGSRSRAPVVGSAPRDIG